MEAGTQAHHQVRFKTFQLNLKTGELSQRGVRIRLYGQPIEVLRLLIENAGEVVTRETLRKALWPEDIFVDFEHSLNSTINRLRDALGDSADASRLIETVPRVGYRFLVSVDPIETPILVETTPNHSYGSISSHLSLADPQKPPQNTSSTSAPVQIEAGSATEPEDKRGSLTPRLIQWTIVTGILLTAVTAVLAFLQMQSATISVSSMPSTYRIDSITTARGDFKDAAISPDGRDVAYDWNGGAGDRYDIYVQRIASPLPMRLTHIKSGFVGLPAWSPDQSEIAFTRCDGVNDGVYIVPALGGPEQKLTSTSCQYHVPTTVAWLPASQMLMVDRCPASGLHGLVLFSMETGQKRCIADLGPTGGGLRRFRYSVSPDQKTIAFIPSDEAPDCEIYTIPVSGGLPNRIVEDKGICNDLMWTPDGKEIVFLSDRTNFSSLWQLPAKGGAIRNSNYAAIGSFSKDGHRLVYAESANGEPPAVWRADLATAGGRVLDNKELIATHFWEADAQPSPDGTHIAWEELRGEVAELWTGRSDGENRRQLTHLNKAIGTPRWSPDGKWIVFDLYFAEATPQIYIIDADGRNLRLITKGPFMNMVPSWSRDGKSIYFTSTRSGKSEVWKHSLESGKDNQLTTRGGFDPFESFDGQTVYFTKFDEAGIWRIPADGGEETLVLEARPQVLYWGHWALTKSGIYFLNADADPRARIEFYDFASRQVSPVLPLEKNAVIMNPGLSAVADGKTIFYLQWDRQSVIKMMEFSNPH